MNIQHQLAAAAFAVIALVCPAWGAVDIDGVNSGTDGDYASFAATDDLVNAGASTLAAPPVYSAAPFFGGPPNDANNDGTVGTAGATADITFWLGAGGGSQYTITYTLDTSTNTLGYDINSIQTIHGWTSGSGNQKNQNYTVAVSTVADTSFTDIATVAYLPFTSANNTASTKVTVTEDAIGVLAFGVDEIRFTYTVPASGGSNPSPTIREIDVIGVPNTGAGPITVSSYAYDGTGAGATPSGSFPDSGPNTELTDGIFPPTTTFGNAEWVGFNILDPNADHPQVTFDFGTTQDVLGIDVTYLHSTTQAGGSITAPEEVLISVGTDGLTYSSTTSYFGFDSSAGDEIRTHTLNVASLPTARYYRLEFRNASQWTFLSEVSFVGPPPTDSTPPNLVSISDDQGGGPVTPSTLVTYTVTFNEDIDDSTVDSSDFDTTGTANASIGTVIEISPGIFTVEVTPTTGGTLQLRIPTGATINDTLGNPLDSSSALLDDTIITVDGTAPTVASIVDNQGGGPVDPYLPVVYTVTFSEDMDASSVTTADFDNAGTSSAAILSVSESSPGVFTVAVRPDTAGTLQFRIPSGASLSDVAGNTLNVGGGILDDTTITVNSISQMITFADSLGTPFISTPWASSVATSDLINAGQPTLASSWVTTPFFGPNATNDGAAIPEDSTTNAYFAFNFSSQNNFPVTALYDLDVTTNTEGYDITSIETFMGWHANSGMHANQNYIVEVSTVGSTAYTLLATVVHEPFAAMNSAHHESHVVIADNSGVLASGVDSIRFTFNTPSFTGGNAPGAVIREIDVHGIPTSSAPSDPILLAVSQSGGTLSFSWNSNDGKQYDLVSTTDLVANPDPSAWLPYNDGVTTHENIAASGTGTNTLNGVLLVGGERYFALIEE